MEELFKLRRYKCFLGLMGSYSKKWLTVQEPISEQLVFGFVFLQMSQAPQSGWVWMAKVVRPAQPCTSPPSSFSVATHLQIQKSQIIPAFWRKLLPVESPLEENLKCEDLPVTSGET